MTSPSPPERLAVIGTGLVGTSIAMAATRVGCAVSGWDLDPAVSRAAADRSGLAPAGSLEEAVGRAEVVIVCAPIAEIPALAARALQAAPSAVVSDAGSVKARLMIEVRAAARPESLARFVGGHPMGGSERSGPEHASASVVDGIAWVLTPGPESGEDDVARLATFVQRVGARPVRMDAERHDRLVAFVSHLPQVASTALMELAATEEAGEPEILLLAAGGFRDLTRLAASNPALWSDILLANREAMAAAIDLYAARLQALRQAVLDGRGADVEATFERAKRARLRLGAKPQVRSGVAVIQVEVPDRPGSLALLTTALSEADVNIEDLQIVHSPEGGRGLVHLTVAAPSSEDASSVLSGHGFDPIRLA